MSDVNNRDELERRLARAISKLFKGMANELIAALGDPPDIANLPPEFWAEFGKELSAEIAPFLESIYLEQALALMNTTPIGVEWTLINLRAIEWASQYTFQLVSGITQTSRELLQRSISAFFERGETRAQLEQRLLSAFGPVRAEMIAVTEVTRASSEGEQAIARELAASGIEMTPIWQTNNDELVCPICQPRNGKPITDGMYPPAHPRCRCWVNHVLPKVK